MRQHCREIDDPGALVDRGRPHRGNLMLPKDFAHDVEPARQWRLAEGTELNRSMACRPSPLLGLTPAPSAKPKSRERMRLAPQGVCHTERLNPDLSPPHCFVPTSMQFAMMSTAQWDRELITHLAS
jgi:hypothetical protein